MKIIYINGFICRNGKKNGLQHPEAFQTSSRPTKATTKEIQKAALKLSRKFHSDKFAQLYEKGMIDLDADLFKTVFNIVFAARDCLVNETKLKKYLQDKESDTVKHDYSHYGKKFTSKCNK